MKTNFYQPDDINLIRRRNLRGKFRLCTQGNTSVTYGETNKHAACVKRLLILYTLARKDLHTINRETGLVFNSDCHPSTDTRKEGSSRDSFAH